VAFDLILRQHVTSVSRFAAAVDLVADVDVVLDIFQPCVVRHTVEQLTDFLFGGARNTAILACFQGLSNASHKP